MNCPDCGKDLNYGAKSCICGWGAKKRDVGGYIAPKTLVACEAEGCRQMSLIKMPDRSNLCEFHYSKWWAKNYWRVSGAQAIGTPQQCIDRIRVLMATPKQRTRADWIAHWQAILANPKTSYARQCAVEALKNLGATHSEREPGSDDDLGELAESIAERMTV